MLPERLYPLRYHAEQRRLVTSPARFKVVPAGRRSGKTERAKRQIIRAALSAKNSDARFAAAAPTRDQAKQIFWTDLKAMINPILLSGRPSESELRISLVNGSEIWVVGMDKPERIEGRPWDGIVLDEVANMKATAWPENVRPALSDRKGWAWLIGVPEGRNHYYDLAQRARSGVDKEWDYFSWPSADILDPAEVESARRDLDPLVFAQEYEASFITFEGRCYYNFTQDTHAWRLRYNERAPLIFCFDFNVDPGVAVILQEQPMPGQFIDVTVEDQFRITSIERQQVIGTGVIGEVHIPRNSNTPAVCRKLVADWSAHLGRILCYGDSTGGNRGTAKIAGSDWDLIRAEFRNAFTQAVEYHVSTNPPERSRVNAMNSRLLSSAGVIRLMVDPANAPNTVRDLEGVQLLKGGSGEIDKKVTPNLTHLTDALGYYIVSEFPVAKAGMQRIQLGGV